LPVKNNKEKRPSVLTLNRVECSDSVSIDFAHALPVPLRH
jgi:hypothetical protein